MLPQMIHGYAEKVKSGGGTIRCLPLCSLPLMTGVGQGWDRKEAVASCSFSEQGGWGWGGSQTENMEKVTWTSRK